MYVMFIYKDLPGYGSPPNVIISTITIPKDQTSEHIDIVLSRTTSGAVHLTATRMASLQDIKHDCINIEIY